MDRINDGFLRYCAVPGGNYLIPVHAVRHLLRHVLDEYARTLKRQLAVAGVRISDHVPAQFASSGTLLDSGIVSQPPAHPKRKDQTVARREESI